MRHAIVVSGVAAICVHGFVLFGLHLDQPAVPLPPAPDPIVVGLVAAAPRPGPAQTPAATAPKPEEPKPSEARNTTRPERPPSKPVRPPKEPAPKPKANAKTRATERRDPVAEAAPTQDGPSDSSPPTGRERGSAGGSAAGGASATGGRELSSLPRYRNTPAPKYPPAARRERQEGVVLLAVEVGTNGRPTAVTVKQSSGVAILDEAAVSAVRRWTFEPARSAGLPAASTVEIPVRFSLAD